MKLLIIKKYKQISNKMFPKLHEFSVCLHRDSPMTPWGIRLVGGSDLDTPLIITRVGMVPSASTDRHL